MVIVREASFADLESIIALIKHNDMAFKNKSFEEWLHIWKENPIILEGKIRWPIGWVLEKDRSDIVGFIGNIPIAYEFRSRRLIAASASSWVVNQPYRNRSILLLNAYLGQKDSDIFLNTTANNTAEKVFLTLRASKAPVDSYEISLFAIVNYRNFIHSALIKSGIPLAENLSVPLSVSMRIIDSVKRKTRIPKEISTGEINSVDKFDERFDAFWDAVKAKSDNFLAVRDSRWLKWRFGNLIGRKKAWVFIKESGSSITSYAIFLRQDNPNIGLKRLKLADYQTIDDNAKTLEELVWCGIRKCYEEGIDVLESVGFNAFKVAILKKVLPHKRRLTDWHFLYKAKDKMLAKELENSTVWDPCIYDGDAIL